MKKDAQLTFRIRSELKTKLEKIAAHEGRSVAQICDAFLEAASEAYGEKGSKYIQRFLTAKRNRPPVESTKET